jgi:hypothetical protein
MLLARIVRWVRRLRFATPTTTPVIAEIAIHRTARVGTTAYGIISLPGTGTARRISVGVTPALGTNTGIIQLHLAGGPHRYPISDSDRLEIAVHHIVKRSRLDSASTSNRQQQNRGEAAQRSNDCHDNTSLQFLRLRHVERDTHSEFHADKVVRFYKTKSTRVNQNMTAREVIRQKHHHSKRPTP